MSPKSPRSSRTTGSARPQNGHSKSPYSTSVTGASTAPREWSRGPTGGVSSAGEVAPLLLMQHLMHRGDRDRSFANGRGHTLQAPGADIADREYPGAARREQTGR